jgi:ribosomal-protein-alanine N-acetyltransferase
MKDVTIRTLRQDDARQLLEFELDNRAWFERHIDSRSAAFYSLQGVSQHIAEYLDAHARGNWHPCVILHGDEIVGRANLKDIDTATGCAEVGYRIAEHAAGKGLATRAVKHLMHLARSEWRLARLKADVTANNAASGRVLEKCGFVQGQHHARLAFVKGAWIEGYQFVRALDEA